MTLKIFPIIFVLMVTIGMAQAQPYQETHLFVNGVEQNVGTENPQIIKISSGQVYSTISIPEQESVSCTLLNCVTSVQPDITYGGYTAKISGIMTNQTNQIQLVSQQGQVTYTIVLMPSEPKQVTQDPQTPFGIQMPEIPMVVFVIVGVVGLVGLLLYQKSRGIGKIVTI